MFRFNPNLPFVRDDFPGNYYEDGQFHHARYASTEIAASEILRWQLSGNPQKKEKERDPFRLRIIRDNSFLTSEEDMLVWLGHASFFIRMQGLTFLTDPCLKDLPFIKRLAPLPCALEDLRGIDYLLISHGHRDHYDEDCVNQLIDQNPGMQLLLPLDISQLLGNRRSRVSYQEAAWWQQFRVADGVEVTFLPAKHWNRRWLNDFNRQLWGGFLLRSTGENSRSIYFSGDSAYDDHFSKIKEVIGELDISLLPVGAYKPSYVMQLAHMSPEEAVRAFHSVGGKTFIPMHYGTYDLSDEPIGEPVRKLRRLQEQEAIRGDLKFLAVGEQLQM